MAGSPLSVPSLQAIAVPGTASIIFFLAYSSQYLFYYIEPRPLNKSQALWFNGLMLAVWWSYDRTVTVDPGRKGWVERAVKSVGDEGENESEAATLKKGLRWCRKCDAVKPPRAHHCRQCGRCIPKMDHHCPWTTNCVSHTTFAHFVRFVFYSVISMSILEYHLFVRAMVIWDNRNLPAYLGPPLWGMAHLLVLMALNSVCLFGMTVLFFRAGYSLSMNTTMIESWEIERHEALITRSRKTGGYVYANGGQRMRVERQEFPYDIGIWKNLCQGMGSSNPILWFLPFGGGPTIQTAVDWEVNGFEDASKTWPPPDPEKVPRASRIFQESEREYGTQLEEMEAFKKRQQKDYQRWGQGELADDENGEEYSSESEQGDDGKKGWTNSEGDRLRDFGVDEDADVLAEDDIPLGELLRRRKAKGENV